MTIMKRAVDVLIVGAGPVGVLAANLLGQYGASVLLVDAGETVMEIPRAISFDNETARVLQAAGFGDEARRQMPSVSHVEMISPAGRIGRMNGAGSVDGHPRLLAIFQPGLERMMRNGLERHRTVELRSRCTYVSHREDAEKVVVKLRHDGVEREVHGRYVIGCDGARSAVREHQGWKLDGSTYQQDWLIVDVAQPPQRLDHVEFICDPRRPIAHVPGPDGAQRWEFMLRAGETAEEMERPERVAELVRPWGDVAQMKVLRTSVYRFHARVASSFGRGRIYLAGDAAHLTPPFAGQGLCAGMRDAINLSWKLAAVLHGQAHPQILESYELERRPHVTSMLRLAVVMGMVIMPTNRLYACLKDTLLRFLLRTPLKAHLTDLKIRPSHRYRRGLLLPSRTAHTGAVPGTLLSQHLVRDAVGQIVWSDDALGSSLVLVGMGIDPWTALSASGRAAWQRMGGRLVFVSNQQQRFDPPAANVTVVEDLTGGMLEQFGRNGLIAAVRPDRTILAVCEQEDVEEMVLDIARLLRPVVVERVGQKPLASALVEGGYESKAS
jgi:3-(3-hydroxy-phenyl)propionate hydroxylase